MSAGPTSDSGWEICRFLSAELVRVSGFSWKLYIILYMSSEALGVQYVSTYNNNNIVIHTTIL